MKNKEMVKPNIYGKRLEKKIIDAAKNGELSAFVKHPITGESIRVHPELIKRMQDGEKFSIEDILNKKFD